MTRFAAIALLALVAACGGQRAGTEEVAIEGFLFQPASIEVAVGSTVEWVNRDEILHTVTSSEQGSGLDGTLADIGDRYSFTFLEAGTFSYVCSRHEHMTGSVTVR